MSFDSVPIWAVLVATIGLVFLSIQIGVRPGKRRVLRSEGKLGNGLRIASVVEKE